MNKGTKTKFDSLRDKNSARGERTTKGQLQYKVKQRR